MLWLPLCLLPLVDCSAAITQDVSRSDGHDHEEVAVATRPHIYYCRSPNMEDFTCWWHPLDNLTDSENITYLLTYSRDKGPKHECPDYMTAGPNSCHFDSSHTSIWNIYCMNVTAITTHKNYTSQEHCLDVAEIVQTEAPVNLTYVLAGAGGDELGHRVLLSWKYPVPSDLQYGWITLVYELQYRRLTEPDNWKVMHPLREPHLELLGLPVGDYMVRVRCRSHNYGLWSKWSAALTMSVPARPAAGKQLLVVLLTGVGVVAVLVVAVGVIPQSRRIKEYFLPPIPKPRIIGIDPLLLKKGNWDEINCHFSTFHSYRPPSYTEEVWDQVSADDVCFTTPQDCSVLSNPTDTEKDPLVMPCDLMPVNNQQNAASCVQSLAPYCSSPPEAFTPSLDASSPRLEIMSLPGTDYSMMGHPGLPSPAPDTSTVTASRSPQDSYTCVQFMNDSGTVHLVPCLPPAYCCEFLPFSSFSLAAHKREKEKKDVDHQARKSLMTGPKDVAEAERSGAAVPVLPVSVDNSG